MRSFLPIIERAKPLLGTTVRIRVHGLVDDVAHTAINAAFDEMGRVHSLMSFHEDHSDVSRLNREAHGDVVRVDSRTYEVLARALVFSRLSAGAFDITVASNLVANDRLPMPRSAPRPSHSATWRDIVLLPDNQVRFQQPLWIDLGGIAKGYAVDQAVRLLETFKPDQVCVNAGGDLRVVGPSEEKVRLAVPGVDESLVPMIEITNGSLASSCNAYDSRGCSINPGTHIDTQCGRPISLEQFVSVAATQCIHADALTKVVMARGACSLSILNAFNARAIVHDTRFGWREFGSGG